MPYISVKHASAFLDMPVSTVYGWVRQGIIPVGVAITIGGRILINREKLESMLAGETSEMPEAHKGAVYRTENPSTVADTVSKLYNSVKSNPAYHARKA